MTVNHSASNAALAFFASGNEWRGGGDESWGMDDFVILPEPASMMLIAAGLVGLRRSAQVATVNDGWKRNGRPSSCPFSFKREQLVPDW